MIQSPGLTSICSIFMTHLSLRAPSMNSFNDSSPKYWSRVSPFTLSSFHYNYNILVYKGRLDSWYPPSFTIHTSNREDTFTPTATNPLQRPDTALLNHPWSILSWQKTLTNTHHLRFHPPAQISGQPLGLGSEDCILHPALHGRLSSVDI